jgi:hypothetical protein
MYTFYTVTMEPSFAQTSQPSISTVQESSQPTVVHTELTAPLTENTSASPTG